MVERRLEPGVRGRAGRAGGEDTGVVVNDADVPADGWLAEHFQKDNVI